MSGFSLGCAFSHIFSVLVRNGPDPSTLGRLTKSYSCDRGALGAIAIELVYVCTVFAFVSFRFVVILHFSYGCPKKHFSFHNFDPGVFLYV